MYDTGMKVCLYMCTKAFSVLKLFLIQERWQIILSLSRQHQQNFLSEGWKKSKNNSLDCLTSE